MSSRLSLILLSGALAGVLACDDLNESSAEVRTAEEPSADGVPAFGPEVRQPEAPAGLCAGGKVYEGIGGVDLTAGRSESPLEVDRGRVKPYSVLAGEYQRALGVVPSLYPQMASTFGAPPARWYEEAEASAIILYSAFRIGFQGCLDYTATAASFAAAPTDDVPRLD